MDITKLSSIEKCVRKIKPGKIIHLAGLSRPLIVHDKNPERSILLNIIATSNLAIVCKKYNIKLISFPLIMFIQAQKEIIKKRTVYYRVPITLGQNLGQRQQSICLKIP